MQNDFQSGPGPRSREPFRTPDEVASHDNQQPAVPQNPPNTVTPQTAKPRHQAWFKRWPFNKKQTLIGAGVVVVLLGIGLGWFLLHQPKPTPKPVAVQPAPKKIAPKPTTVPSTLTGLPVAPSVNQRPVTGVMIENLPAARPQAGLSQAGVVFEALTEGGITRFLALFQDQLPNNIGPIRSVRPYFLDWDLGFDAPLAHVGGSPQALQEIPQLGVKNLDQMYNGSYYQRISSRPAPHNVYTSLSNLLALEASKGWTSSNFNGFPRKPDAPAKNPSVTSINFNPSYSTYEVQYSYNTANNSYERSVGGSPQIDANTNQQLSPKVVIGMVVPWSQGALDSSDAYYSVYQVIGSGTAYVFQDGTVTVGKWTKTSPTAQISFTTQDGQVLRLDAGQTWITVLGSVNQINYN